MRKKEIVFIVVFLFLFLFPFCSQKERITHQESEEIPNPFLIEFVDDGIVIYPESMEKMKNIMSAKFYFTPVTFWGDERVEDALSKISSFGTSLEYDYPVSESIGFFRIGKGVIGILSLRLVYKTSSGKVKEVELFGKSLAGNLKIKFIPFWDFDSPVLSVYAFQSENNYFFYVSPDNICDWRVAKLPQWIKKFFPVQIKDSHLVGCYTRFDKNGVYCNFANEETKIVDYTPDKFYAEYFGKDEKGQDIYRIYVLNESTFFIFEYKNSRITLLDKEDDVRGVTPSLIDLHLWGDVLMMSTGMSNNLPAKDQNNYVGFRLFYLLKNTDQTMIEAISPGLLRKYFYYPKRVSKVAYTFASVVGGNAPFRPGGVVFDDGSVRIEAFDKTKRPLKIYSFSGKVIGLWVLYHSFLRSMLQYNYGDRLGGDMDVTAIVLTDTNQFFLTGRGAMLQPIRIVRGVLKANYLFAVGSDGSITLLYKIFSGNPDKSILNEIVMVNNFRLCPFSDQPFSPYFFGYNRDDFLRYLNPFLPASQKHIIFFESPIFLEK